LTNAIDKHFQGVIWQRCQVHLMRDVLVDGMKDTFASKTKEDAKIRFRELIRDGRKSG